MRFSLEWLSTTVYPFSTTMRAASPGITVPAIYSIRRRTARRLKKVPHAVRGPDVDRVEVGLVACPDTGQQDHRRQLGGVRGDELR